MGEGEPDSANGAYHNGLLGEPAKQTKIPKARQESGGPRGRGPGFQRGTGGKRGKWSKWAHSRVNTTLYWECSFERKLVLVCHTRGTSKGSKLLIASAKKAHRIKVTGSKNLETFGTFCAEKWMLYIVRRIKKNRHQRNWQICAGVRAVYTPGPRRGTGLRN